jgi:uncharacterized protein YgbK (DUF1537 family)
MRLRADKIAIIADDLTGACDVGAQFLCRGLEVSVVLRRRAIPGSGADILVFNTQSRALTPTAAYRRTYDMVKSMGFLHCEVFLKKIDSAVRGNAGAEIDAIMDALNLKVAFVMPSIPEMHRITRGGFLIFQNKRLEETSFSDDPLHPATESYVPRILETGSRRRIALVDIKAVRGGRVRSRIKYLIGKGAGIIVIDSVTCEDIRNVAGILMKMMTGPLLMAGSLGLAGAISRWVVKPKETSGRHIDKAPNIRFRTEQRNGAGMLVVCGSKQKINAEQISRLKSKSKAVLEQVSIRDIISGRTEKISRVKSSIIESLSSGKDVIIKLLFDANDSVRSIPVYRRILSAISGLTYDIMNMKQVDMLVLIGGETAWSVLRRLGVSHIDLEKNLELGIVSGIMRGGKWDDLRVVTKGGSVGAKHSVLRIWDMLGGQAFRVDKQGKSSIIRKGIRKVRE